MSWTSLGEGVQVADQRLHDLAQAGVRRSVEAGLDGPGQVGVGEVAPLFSWLVGRSPLDLRAAREACQVPLHGLGRVGIQPAAERLLELARERQQRPLVAPTADELHADGQAGFRAHDRDRDRRQPERVGVRAQRQLAARADGLAVDRAEAAPNGRRDIRRDRAQRGAVALEPGIRVASRRTSWAKASR